MCKDVHVGRVFQLCAYMYIHVCLHPCMHMPTYMPTYLHSYVHAYIQAVKHSFNTSAIIHAQTHIHAYTHTHVYTHMRRIPQLLIIATPSRNLEAAMCLRYLCVYYVVLSSFCHVCTCVLSLYLFWGHVFAAYVHV